jgi:hypothetical protein
MGVTFSDHLDDVPELGAAVALYHEDVVVGDLDVCRVDIHRRRCVP